MAPIWTIRNQSERAHLLTFFHIPQGHMVDRACTGWYNTRKWFASSFWLEISKARRKIRGLQTNPPTETCTHHAQKHYRDPGLAARSFVGRYIQPNWHKTQHIFWCLFCYCWGRRVITRSTGEKSHSCMTTLPKKCEQGEIEKKKKKGPRSISQFIINFRACGKIRPKSLLISDPDFNPY